MIIPNILLLFTLMNKVCVECCKLKLILRATLGSSDNQFLLVPFICSASNVFVFYEVGLSERIGPY